MKTITSNSLNSKKTIRSVLFQIFAIFIGLLVICPIIYALLIAFMPANQILKRPPTFIPKKWILTNFGLAIKSTPLARFMLNSLIMALCSSILRVITSAMAAYAFAFYKFKGKNILFYLFMGTMMIPADVVTVTNYQTVAHMGMINTYMGMMIVFFVNATNIFLVRQYFLQFSKSLKEASIIDGCSNFMFFVKILLPLSTPVLTTVFISSFISTWNQYLWPLLVTNENLMRTVQVGVTMLNFPDGVVYGPVMAASILVLLPTLLIFIIFQKKIVGGIMGGSVKG